MISAELDLRGIDARHWTNWWHLLVPPRVLTQPRWALVVLEHQKPIKVIIAGTGARGAIEPPALPPLGKSLESWAKLLDVGAVIAIERTIIAELSAEVEAQLGVDQDYAEQGLVVLRALKRRAGHGVWSEPPLLDLLPAPSYEAIQRTFDLLVPDRSALVAYVIDDDRARIHSSIIAVKQDGDITRAATHRAIADLVPEVSFARDWAKGYKRVLEAVEDRFAKPSLAVFLERATVLRIITGPGDQLPRELNSHNVVIDPTPGWLLGLLGGATVAAMAGRAASAIASMLPQGARDRASAIAHRAGAAIKESGPFAQLGFDPIELWSRLKHHYRE